MGRIAARLAGVPVILYTPHAFSFQCDNSPLINRLYIELERFAIRFTDRIIAISPGEIRAALDTRLCHKSMMEIIENGVDMELFLIESELSKLRKELRISNDQQVVGTVARFCPQKGYEYLIRAVRIVINTNPSVKFLFIGDGELRKKIECMIDRLELSDNVLLTGQRTDVVPFYTLMDIFVLPSLWEGLPYTILEAMYSGKPVVATSIYGTEDIVVHGKTGILVPPKDPEALANAIIQLLKAKRAANKMGQEGKRLVEKKYQLKDQIKKLETFYIGMVKKKVKNGIDRI